MAFQHSGSNRKKRTQGTRPPSRQHGRNTGSIVFQDASNFPDGSSVPGKNRSPGKKNLPRHILENRAQMGENGVLIVSFIIDATSRALLRPVRLESRGYLLPNEVRFAHANLQKSARSSYETTLQDVPDIEERDFLKIIKQDMERTSEQTLRKVPLIIPVFHHL